MNVSDIQGDDRRSLEHILGRQLQEGEQVYIMAYQPGVVPDKDTRRKAKQRLLELSRQAAVHAKEHGHTQDDIDDAIDEATEHVRYGNG